MATNGSRYENCFPPELVRKSQQVLWKLFDCSWRSSYYIMGSECLHKRCCNHIDMATLLRNQPKRLEITNLNYKIVWQQTFNCIGSYDKYYLRLPHKPKLLISNLQTAWTQLTPHRASSSSAECLLACQFGRHLKLCNREFITSSIQQISSQARRHLLGHCNRSFISTRWR